MINGISVVICCYNSEEKLPKVLDHLERQEVADDIPWEVLVIDNASTDRTAQVAVDCWNRKNIPLRVVDEPRPGLSNARLAGFNNATKDIISFVDDDNWVENRWIRKVYDFMGSDAAIGIMGGRGKAAFESDPPFWFEQYQTAFAVGSAGKTTGFQQTYITGAGMNVRKSAWDHLRSNGFEFILSGRKGKALSSGEDVELSYALLLAGYKLYYDDNLLFYHFMPAGRLRWDYLVKLFGAFGRFVPVADIYSSLLSRKGIRKLVRMNTLLSTLRSVYRLFLFMPRQLSLLFERKEGNEKVLDSVYLRNILIQKIRLFFIFPSYVTRVKKGAWIKEAIKSDIPDGATTDK
jgi:glycosyltransferase involved in cell wall biosynthesis